MHIRIPRPGEGSDHQEPDPVAVQKEKQEQFDRDYAVDPRVNEISDTLRKDRIGLTPIKPYTRPATKRMGEPGSPPTII